MLTNILVPDSWTNIAVVSYTLNKSPHDIGIALSEREREREHTWYFLGVLAEDSQTQARNLPGASQKHSVNLLWLYVTPGSCP